MVRISKTTSNGYVRLVLEVKEISTNIASNTSTIYWELWLERNTSYAYDNYNESLAEVEINGQYVLSKYVSFDLRNSQWATFGSGTMTIPHNEDGTKSITIWARLTNVADQGNINWFSGTVNLSNIPRASAISSVSATELGKPVTIQIDKKVSSFTHQILWRINSSEWVDEGGNHDTSLTITPSIEYANRITDSDTGNLDVSVRTFNGDVQIGEDVYKFNVPIRVPENIVPTIESINVEELNAKIAEVIPSGNFIKNKSSINISVVGAQGAAGSRIIGYEVTLDNLIMYSSVSKIDLKKSGTFTILAKARDSRNRIATKSLDITVLDYYAPKIAGFLANRAGNNTNKTIISTVLANVCPVVINGVNKNPYTVTIQYSEKNSNRWFDAVNLTNETAERLNRQINSGSFYDLTKSYNLKLTIQDKLSDSVHSVITISTSNVLMVLGDDRLAFGGFPELKNSVESYKPVTFYKTLNVEEGIYSRGKPIQEFQLTQPNGKSLQAKGSANDILTAGFYYSNNMSGLPAELDSYQKYGYLQVSTHPNDDNFAMQTYVPNNTDVMYMRRKVNTYGWLPWKKFTPSDVPVSGQWTNVELLNGWKSYGDDYPPVQYKITGNGSVELRGSCKGGNPNSWAHVFKLPKSVRIEKQIYIQCITQDYKPCVMVIYGNGDGTVVCGHGVDNQWLCFDGVTITN